MIRNAIRSSRPSHDSRRLWLALLTPLALTGPLRWSTAAAGDPPAGGCLSCTALDALLEGQAAPGTDAAFQSFDRPNLSAKGAVAFTGDTDGATDSDDIIFVDGTLVAREGQTAPGAPEATLGAFEFFETSHQVNTAGELVFITSLLGVPTTADRAVYQGSQLIARKGEPAVGVTDRVYHGFGFAGLTDDGRVGFLADLDGSTSDDSVIYLDGTPLLREGDPVPGRPDLTWDGNFDELQWNGAGDCLFEGNTSQPSSMDIVLVRRRQTAAGVVNEIVAQEGQLVETIGGTDALASIQQSALAENGLWAFRGTLADAPAETEGIIISETGFTRREGEMVDELDGVVLAGFGGVGVNSRGDVAYVAELGGAVPVGVDEGIFINGCLLLTDGNPAPGLPAGTVFSDFGFEDLQINDDRQVVFQASFTGTVSGDGLFVLDCPRCDEDLDFDGEVDVDDLILVLLAWNSASSGADIDGDGTVGVDDLAAIVLAWGVCPLS